MANTKYSEKLEALFDKYNTEAVDKIAQEAFDEVIKPLCKKRNWRFASDKYVWWIDSIEEYRFQYPEDHPDDEEFKKAWKVLDKDIPGFSANSLGFYMPDYDPTEEGK